VNRGFRKALGRGQLLAGTIVTLEAPAVAERLAEAGFDWLFLDGEHAPLDAARMQAILQAVGGRCPCLIRIPSIDEVWIKQALDIGADGLIVPRIRSAAEAARVVDWCRYPPEGARSVGVGRAQGYGARLGEYLSTANARVAVVLQIEHADAVASLREIAAVDGVDALFVGPYDLSASLGAPGEVGDARVVAANQRVAEVCREHGVVAGIFGIDAEEAGRWIAEGFTLIAVGIDTVFLGGAAEAALKAVRDRGR
jgi:2-keto-3-deoxy-L-rhamnonate aldolase RhmA